MATQTEDELENLLENLFSEEYSSEIIETKHTDEPLPNQDILIEDVLLLPSLMPNHYITISILNVFASFYLGSGALLLALLALFFSLKTIDYNSEEDFEMASITSQYSMALNLTVTFIIMFGYLLAVFEFYSWRYWIWNMSYF